MKYDIKKKLIGKSDRVKCVDMHPTEPWVLSSLYTGHVYIWNYETQTILKTFEISDEPVRTARFIARKNWLISGSDDMVIRVYNYNTYERMASFTAHGDYIRALVVHPSKPYVLSSADDLSIKCWDWEKNWQCIKVFQGHSHYVMCLAINYKDLNTFASGSLDRSIKVWNLGSSTPNYTLEGAHDKGVCAIDYYPGADKPLLASGGDDKLVKIWDYQNKHCVSTLTGHMNNISCLVFHPTQPILFSGSEDDTLRMWNMNTFKQDKSVSFGMDRIWSLASHKTANLLSIGQDKGTLVTSLGTDLPSLAMDCSSGKLIYAKTNDLFSANLKQGVDVVDGEPILLQAKELSSCEFTPTSILFASNYRHITLLSVYTMEYIIYSTLGFRQKAFGNGSSFSWGSDGTSYAVLNQGKCDIYRNFVKLTSLNENVTDILGNNGPLLSVMINGALCFYQWPAHDDPQQSLVLIRRIDLEAKMVSWSENSEKVLITNDGEGAFILSFNAKLVETVLAQKEQGEKYRRSNGNSLMDVDGIEGAFHVIAEVGDEITSALWIGDALFFTSSLNRLAYLIPWHGEIQSAESNQGDLPSTNSMITTITTVTSSYSLIGYMKRPINRLFLATKENVVTSFSFSLDSLEFMMLVNRGQIQLAMTQLLPQITEVHDRSKLATFLYQRSHGDPKMISFALEVTMDKQQKFQFALALQDLSLAFKLAAEQVPSKRAYIMVASLALAKRNQDILRECYMKAEETSTVMLIDYITGNFAGLREITSSHMNASLSSTNDFHVLFLQALLGSDHTFAINLLLQQEKYVEAVLYARTYLPAKYPELLSKWQRDDLRQQLQSQFFETVENNKMNESAFFSTPLTKFGKEDELNGGSANFGTTSALKSLDSFPAKEDKKNRETLDSLDTFLSSPTKSPTIQSDEFEYSSNANKDKSSYQASRGDKSNVFTSSNISGQASYMMHKQPTLMPSIAATQTSTEPNLATTPLDITSQSQAVESVSHPAEDNLYSTSMNSISYGMGGIPQDNISQASSMEVHTTGTGSVRGLDDTYWAPVLESSAPGTESEGFEEELPNPSKPLHISDPFPQLDALDKALDHDIIDSNQEYKNHAMNSNLHFINNDHDWNSSIHKTQKSSMHPSAKVSSSASWWTLEDEFSPNDRMEEEQERNESNNMDHLDRSWQPQQSRSSKQLQPQTSLSSMPENDSEMEDFPSFSHQDDIHHSDMFSFPSSSASSQASTPAPSSHLISGRNKMNPSTHPSTFPADTSTSSSANAPPPLSNLPSFSEKFKALRIGQSNSISSSSIPPKEHRDHYDISAQTSRTSKDQTSRNFNSSYDFVTRPTVDPLMSDINSSLDSSNLSTSDSRSSPTTKSAAFPRSHSPTQNDQDAFFLPSDPPKKLYPHSPFEEEHSKED